jgi:hypothetical protein
MGLDFIPGLALGEWDIVGDSSGAGGSWAVVLAPGVGVPGTKVCSVGISGFTRGSG